MIHHSLKKEMKLFFYFHSVHRTPNLDYLKTRQLAEKSSKVLHRWSPTALQGFFLLDHWCAFSSMPRNSSLASLSRLSCLWFHRLKLGSHDWNSWVSRRTKPAREIPCTEPLNYHTLMCTDVPGKLACHCTLLSRRRKEHGATCKLRHSTLTVGNLEVALPGANSLSRSDMMRQLP